MRHEAIMTIAIAGRVQIRWAGSVKRRSDPE